MIASRKALIIVAAFVLMALGLPWGGNVPAAFAQIQVTSASPSTGDQGTLGLNVTIGGKGFKKGAKANFYLKGTTNPAGITVRATKFVSDASLVATIDISAGATPDAFDIVVANADGRTGKGTELFKVTVKINPCTQPDPVPTPSAYLSSVPGFPGFLDSTFGNGTGRVIGPRYLEVGFAGGNGNPPVAIQNVAGEARVVVVGTSHNVCVNNSGYVWAVVRYLPDGSLDQTFGSDGVATEGLPASDSGGVIRANSVAIQQDNKIVVVGSTQAYKYNTAPTIARLNVDGSPDLTFGTLGVVTPPGFGRTKSGALRTVAIQSDGAIVAAGEAQSSDGGQGYVVRVHPDGTVDTSFNPNNSTPSPFFWASRIQRIGSEERIVVAGAAHDSFGQHAAAVWRFTGSGAVDKSFGSLTDPTDPNSERSGMVLTSFHGDMHPYFFDYFNDLAIDSSNRIVAAGYAGHSVSGGPSESQLAMARYDVSGDLDLTFGSTGKVLASFGPTWSMANATAIQQDGRILIVGRSVTAEGIDALGIGRFNVDGTADATFGNGGWASDSIIDAKRTGSWTGVVVQPDGNIVCAGSIYTESDHPFFYAVLARYWQ
jgi:uncharacterized delta-60 repeat protein